MAANDKTSTEIMKEKFEGKEMSVEELENVSGGSYNEMAMDSRFLNYLLGDKVCRRRDFNDWGKLARYEKELEQAWAKVGVRIIFANSNSLKNGYVINHNLVSRREAFEHAQKVLGKQVKDSDWM